MSDETAREAAQAELVRLYEERFDNLVSEDAAGALLLELLDDPQARPLVLRAFPELADP